MNKNKISIYTPCFNEEKNIQYCYSTIKDLFKNKLKDYDYEHIFGDNCSEDNSLEILRDISSKDKNVKVISYSRNFGAFQSLYNGAISATGDAIICISADLQDPPELIPKMIEKWQNGYDVVYGKKIAREESFVMENLRKFYYKMVKKFSYIDIPENVGEFCLINKKVQDAIKLFDDYYPYLRGMIANCGFKRAFIEYTWKKRKFGKSTGSPYILIDNAINGLISFSNFPMRICLFSGMIISFISIAFSIYSFFVALLFPKEALPGISMLIVAIFFFFGVTLFFLGVVGEYISAIHSQVRKKPLVIINEKINFD